MATIPSTQLLGTRFNMLKELGRLTEQQQRTQLSIGKLLILLAKDCKHEQQVAFNWEHDDGYGRQTQHTGFRCRICGSKDHYQQNRWVKPEDCE